MIQIEKTADGSNTLFVKELDEHYHSVKGALTESEHIFIRTGLRHCPLSEVRVLEVGFGTGLNAFLTLIEAQRTARHIVYTALERYPLEENVVRQLRYPELIAPEQDELFYALHRAEWGKPQPIAPYFTLLKEECDFTARFPDGEFDVVYFDAFAPEKQPEMWTPEIFGGLRRAMSPGGTLTTYCAKGAVRRTLQAAGFTVERLPGPPGGKREMLRATVPGHPEKHTHTPTKTPEP